jgi:hypothetical protein
VHRQILYRLYIGRITDPLARLFPEIYTNVFQNVGLAESLISGTMPPHCRLTGTKKIRKNNYLDLVPVCFIIIEHFFSGIYRTNLAAAGGMPTSPELIRMEVAITHTDFNARLKQVHNQDFCKLQEHSHEKSVYTGS